MLKRVARMVFMGSRLGQSLFKRAVSSGFAHELKPMPPLSLYLITAGRYHHVCKKVHFGSLRAGGVLVAGNYHLHELVEHFTFLLREILQRMSFRVVAVFRRISILTRTKCRRNETA